VSALYSVCRFPQYLIPSSFTSVTPPSSSSNFPLSHPITPYSLPLFDITSICLSSFLSNSTFISNYHFLPSLPHTCQVEILNTQGGFPYDEIFISSSEGTVKLLQPTDLQMYEWHITFFSICTWSSRQTACTVTTVNSLNVMNQKGLFSFSITSEINYIEGE
jgi:hypothetical protein